MCAAIRQGHEAVVEALLKRGARYDITCRSGYSDHPPLWIALEARRADIVRLLLEAGVSPFFDDPHADHSALVSLLIEPKANLDEVRCFGNGNEVAKVMLQSVARKSSRDDLVRFATSVIFWKPRVPFAQRLWTPLSAAAFCATWSSSRRR